MKIKLNAFTALSELTFESMIKAIITFFIVSLPISAQARDEFEGFFTPADVVDFPLSSVHKSIYKLEIADNMHGTAFAITPEILITNVHNITRCLLDYGYKDTGYDGSDGELECKSLAIIMPSGKRISGVQLLGANSRSNPSDLDIAIIKVVNLQATPLAISSLGASIDDSAFVVGFPGETYRSREKLKSKHTNLTHTMTYLNEIELKISKLDSSIYKSSEIFNFWLMEGFIKIQPLVSWSEFLSGSMIGNDWVSVTAYTSEKPNRYQKNLLLHINNFKRDILFLLEVINRSLLLSLKDYPDADGSLKLSNAVIVGKYDEVPGVKILKSDGRPGSSGSPVINENGVVVGIVFALFQNDSVKTQCLLDSITTSTESSNFIFCSDLRLAFVSSDKILEKMSIWNIPNQKKI